MLGETAGVGAHSKVPVALQSSIWDQNLFSSRK
jgi:hypothetical protein